MCGIAGFNGSFDRQLLRRMSDALTHRGPDSDGIFHDPSVGIGFAHRRLAIIDLSPSGRQPLSDKEGRSVIVFNGEIYNYQELRQELLCDGFEFRGTSDTEVLLNLYLRDGEALLKRLKGIYAFAIWDSRKRELFLARDEFGVKPLYFAQTPSGIIFASEIKSILQCDEVNRTIDADALRAHLAYLWSPAPHTILQFVKKLEPGTAMRIAKGKVVRKWRHYTLPVRSEREPRSIKAAIENVRCALRTAVRRQLVADVPIGAFLSGGLDSSSLVALAREMAPGQRLQCFTISTDDKASRREGMTSDLPYAKRVAEYLGVDLHTVHVGPEMADDLPEMLYQLDEPLADPAPLNVFYISKLAREHDIKVLLSGAGGDDIFTGYRRHLALANECYWAWLPKPARVAIAGLARALPAKPVALRRLRKGFRYADLDDDVRLVSYFNWLESEQCEVMLASNVPKSTRPNPLLESLDDIPKNAPPLDRLLYLECRHFLADHNLAYTDKMSMAVGVEVRVPLLDRDLVDLAFQLPAKFKQRGFEGKWIFKKAMEGILPNEVIYRPKTGFGAPIRSWLHGPLKTLLHDVLSPQALKRRGLFDPASIQSLLAADRDGRIDASYSLFSALCIELWCERFLR